MTRQLHADYDQHNPYKLSYPITKQYYDLPAAGILDIAKRWMYSLSY